MLDLPALIGMATAFAIGAVSPWPSFVMVARTAAGVGRRNGVLAALGMGLGGLVFSIASLLGVHGVLLAVPSLYLVLKVGSVLYLAYLGIRIGRGGHAVCARRPGQCKCARVAPILYLGSGHATQQSQDRHRVRQRVCCLPACGRVPGLQDMHRVPGLPDRSRLV